MQQDTTLFWLFFFIFQVVLCFFGLFSQNVFIKTTAFDKKIHFNGRVYLFFLSVGYQTILITFLAMTVVCLHFGSMFEVDECREARILPLKLHNFGEFTIVIFHFFINLDRLLLAFRPFRTEGRASKVYFYFSIFISFVLNEDFRKSIAFGSIFLVNGLNLLIEFKLYYYTSVVFANTIGIVPLERRFELSTSVAMIRCFLPASICSLVLKFTVLAFFSISAMLKDPEDLPPFYFVLNVVSSAFKNNQS
ncbi:hypothetical protein CAEBREN_30718 [Caenorhabditis brenneri]|uniref:Uncharacterized protein n=1 Tax=Caenorhabditis brenneri TaxID=135651 RepID=G0N8P0_CAEBE|nr:hypothetical protein CAEBREN_30718 [Caenorhabditis brenneri]